MKVSRNIVLFFAASFLLLSIPNVVLSQSRQQGHIYTVKPGDSLSKIAKEKYGDPNDWKLIFDATNKQSTNQSGIAPIANPDRIVAGRKVWVPDPGEGHLFPQSLQDIQNAYFAAIRDAEIAEPHEISKDLIAIVESNTDLTWSEDADGRRVLVVTWTSWAGYDERVGKDTKVARDVWVTTVPELRNFCSRYRHRHNLVLRLEQILGLPPGNGKTRFVELWVHPEDLFRPSPDPEVSDHEAELTFPISNQMAVHPEYKEWYNDLKATSYGKNGYPWTRLGYTYDWGNPASEIGLSEFVISKGASVEIKAVWDIDQYCR